MRPGCGSRRDTEALRAILLDAAGTRELPDDTKAGPVSAASIVAIEIHIIIVPVPPSHADPSLRLTPGPRVHAKSRTGILPPTAARRINVEFTNLWILRRTVARKDSAAPPAEKRFVGGSVITTWATWIPMATRQEDLSRHCRSYREDRHHLGEGSRLPRCQLFRRRPKEWIQLCIPVAVRIGRRLGPRGCPDRHTTLPPTIRRARRTATRHGWEDGKASRQNKLVIYKSWCVIVGVRGERTHTSDSGEVCRD